MTDNVMSPSIDKIVGALLKVQLKLKGVKKSGWNPHFKSKFATLSDCFDATRDLLLQNGILIMQPPNKDVVLTILFHESGQWIKSEFPLPAPSLNTKDFQALGSAISYARRYSLASMVGLISDEDDDGQGIGEGPGVSVSQADRLITKGKFSSKYSSKTLKDLCEQRDVNAIAFGAFHGLSKDNPEKTEEAVKRFEDYLDKYLISLDRKN